MVMRLRMQLIPDDGPNVYQETIEIQDRVCLEDLGRIRQTLVKLHRMNQRDEEKRG